MIAAVAGEEARIPEKEALKVHSMLFEQFLLFKEVWKAKEKDKNELPKPEENVLGAEQRTKKLVDQHLSHTDRQTPSEPSYSLEKLVDNLRMFVHDSADEIIEVMRTVLHAEGCAVPSRTNTQELRKTVAQYKFDKQDNSVAEPLEDLSSLTSLLEEIVLAGGNVEFCL